MVEIPMKAAWKSLPSDCWEAIFSYLGDEELKAVSLTCKDFLAYSSAFKKRLKVVHPEISMLSRHLNRFTRLKTIDLLEFEGNIDEAIIEIACSGSNLKACSFSDDGIYSKIPSASGLQLLASRLRLLKKIHLFSSHAYDQFIVALSINCVFLKDVSIVTWGARGDRGRVTKSTIAQLLRNRPNLEALSIDCIVQDDSIPMSESSLVTIEDSISHARALTSLVVGGMSNTDKVLRAIAKAKLRLNNLGLIACADLTVSGLLMALSNHLTKLRIERASLTDEDMEVLVLEGDAGRLTHIEINKCQVTGATMFLLLTKCPSLVDIRMIGTMLDGPFPFSKNHKIQCLCLKSYRRASGIMGKQLGRLFPNLKVLDLSGFHTVTTKQIQAILKRCKHVRELNLAKFQEAKMIEEDDSELLNLEVLKLSYSRINDEGLAMIAKKCPRLVSLDLDRCWCITTEGIKQVVENIKTLTFLDLLSSGDNNLGGLLEWMLSTGNLASLKKICLWPFTTDERDQFLQHGCLLLYGLR